MEESTSENNFFKSKYIFIILISVILIIIIVYIFVSPVNKTKLSILDSLPKTQEGIGQAVNLVKVESVDELKIELCDKLENIERVAVCYIQTAVYEKDDKYCNLFPSEYIKPCKDHVNFAIAVNNKDISVCNKFDDARTKDSCIQSIAVKSLDASLCEKIENKSTSSLGEGLFTAYDDCYGQIADAKNDTLLCEKILGEERRNYCYSVLGSRLNDQATCNKISGKQADFYLNQCLLIIVRTRIIELSECKQFSDSNIVKECSLFIAEKTLNLSICNDIYPEKDLLKADYIPSSGTRGLSPLESCYGKIIFQIKDENKCNAIINNYWKDYCIREVRINNK
ncbi:MAG: hypothetical protein AABW82_03140 [Nanoarchaeota archaeon]